MEKKPEVMIHSEKGKRSAILAPTSHLLQRVGAQLWLWPQHCRNPLSVIFLPALLSRPALACLFCFSLLFPCHFVQYPVFKHARILFGLHKSTWSFVKFHATVYPLFNHHFAFPHGFGLFHRTGLPEADLPGPCEVCMLWRSTPLPLLISSPLPHHQRLQYMIMHMRHHCYL